MKRLLAGLMALCALTGASGAAGVCATKAELKFLQAAALQQQLMAAALSCHFAADYSRYVSRFQDGIVAYDRALKAFFRRRGSESYDAFKSRIAKDVSQRSLSDPHFCREARAIFDLALRRSASASGALHPVATGYETCRLLPGSVEAANPPPLLAAALPVPKPRPLPVTRLAAPSAPLPAVSPAAVRQPAPAAPVKIAAQVPAPPPAARPSLSVARPAPAQVAPPQPHPESLAARDEAETWSTETSETGGETGDDPVAETASEPDDAPPENPPPRPAAAAPRPAHDAAPSGNGRTRRPEFSVYAQSGGGMGGNIPNAYQPGAYWVSADDPLVAPARLPARMVRGPDGRWYRLRPGE